jgi:hypothetical protein
MELRSVCEFVGSVVIGVVGLFASIAPEAVFQVAYPWTPQHAGEHEFIAGCLTVFPLAYAVLMGWVWREEKVGVK